MDSQDDQKDKSTAFLMDVLLKFQELTEESMANATKKSDVQQDPKEITQNVINELKFILSGVKLELGQDKFSQIVNGFLPDQGRPSQRSNNSEA